MSIRTDEKKMAENRQEIDHLILAGQVEWFWYLARLQQTFDSLW